jgi:tetratricopeptide (TPR) repeat protein
MPTNPRIAVLFLAISLSLACHSSPEGDRVLVLGLDGVDPSTVDLLISEGKLPHFARLREHGAYGRLRSSQPLISPIIWTTIATGKPPDLHRIGHFVAVNRSTGEQLPVTSRMRKVKALWNILSEAERSVAVVGWWATWPAEAVRGTIVSDHLCYHFLFEEGFEPSGDLTGVVSPHHRLDALSRLIRRPADLTMEEIAPFVDVSAEEFGRPFEFNDDLGHFKWALTTSESYRRIWEHLWREEDPDLLMVYIEAVDSTSHLFGHLFRTGDLAGELEAQRRRYGHAVERIYLYADQLVGEAIEAMDDRTALIVLSDHGFDLGALPIDPSKTRDLRRVSAQHHRIEGILYMYGRNVKPGVRIDQAEIVDIAPTLLTLLSMPPAEDMPGRVLSEALDLAPLSRIDTYESGKAASGSGTTGSSVDPEILEKLRSLGYLDTVSPDSDRTMAGALFEAGHIEEALDAYRELVRLDPHDATLRASLAGVLGELGRYDEALEQSARAIELSPLLPTPYHNRAVIHERRGDRDAAVRDYREALRYAPDYEPSRTALRRILGEAVGVQPDASPATMRALRLAEEASGVARRGEYGKAMALLDQARRIAPEYALIYQYRSNVAYLMGDREEAIRALRKGLELEPDNVLFRENLRRLRETDER